ncbi:MAG: hypothetical protein QXY53_05805 [Desulfurococcaceae archaeon]
MASEEVPEKKGKEIGKEEVKTRKETREVMEEIRELEIVKEMISEWFDKLSVIVKEIIGTITSSIDGRKLSEEVVEMYRRLREANVPDAIINEMIRDFYKKKLEAMPRLSDLITLITEKLLTKPSKKVEEKVIKEAPKPEEKKK